jgi:hypothetical protein
MKKKLKLLLLRLFGWKKVNNPKYPIEELFHKSFGYGSTDLGWRLQFKDTFIHFLFEDKSVMPVFGMCAFLHVLIFIRFKEFFSMPLGAIILSISLIDIGVTLCILYAIKKWKGGKNDS